MFRRNFVFVCALFVCLAGSAFAQSLEDADSTNVPLIVEKGFPLQVLLIKKLQFKENESVRAKVIEPVYSFDREVIPAGAEVEGKITGFHKAGKWKGISAKLGGNFTPLSEPEITFHTLVLKDGTRIPIETSVVPGSEKVVRDSRQGSELKSSLVSTNKKPGKEKLKSWLWGMAPYHPRYLPIGTSLSAELLTPLNFGTVDIAREALEEIGSAPPDDCIVAVRLVTPLDSHAAKPGAPVEALLTRPVFSKDHKLIFPVGARLHGHVTGAKAARAFHHNGQLAFAFTKITPPVAWMSSVLQSQEVEGSLVNIQVAHDMKNLRIKERNTTGIVESKKRFIAPAWSFFKAGRSLNHNADPFDTALVGAYRGKFLKQATGGSESGFGLPASISGAMVPPIGIGLGFYGAARSVYSNFLGKGRDINLPDNTEMEIRLEKR